MTTHSQSSEPAPASPVADAQRRRDRLFATEHLMGDLKGRSVRGGAMTLGAQGAKFVLRTGSTMVLARLLTPADFGLVAMVTAVTGFVDMFKDAGLSTATVQKDRITHEQISTLFWTNLGLGALLVLVTASLAPLIAWFYTEPRLVYITLAIGCTFIFSGLAVQHQALLKRQMRFRDLAIVEIASVAASVMGSIAVATVTRSYWALVAGAIFGATTNVVGVWIACRWLPGLPRRGTGVRSMLRFGGNVMGFDAVNYFSRNADNILIGWWWGAGSLGIYSKAYSLLMLPLVQINAPIIRATLPALSRLQDDPDRYRRAYTKMLETICMITMPLVGILIATADLVIEVVLGRDWSAAAPIFAWLGVAGMCQPINNTLGSLLVSQGRTRDYLWAGIATSFMTVAVFAGTVRFGVTVMAAGYSIATLLQTPVLWWWCGRTGPVSARDIAGAVYLQVASTLILIGSCVLLRRLELLEYTFLNGVVGVLVGLALAFALFRFTKRGSSLLANFTDALQQLKPKANA